MSAVFETSAEVVVPEEVAQTNIDVANQSDAPPQEDSWFVPSKLLCISNSPPLSATPTNVDAPVQNKLEFSFCEPLQKSITSTPSFQPQFLSIENMISNIMASYTEMLTQMKTDMSDIKEELYDQKIQFKNQIKQMKQQQSDQQQQMKQQLKDQQKLFQ